MKTIKNAIEFVKKNIGLIVGTFIVAFVCIMINLKTTGCLGLPSPTSNPISWRETFSRIPEIMFGAIFTVIIMLIANNDLDKRQ